MTAMVVSVAELGALTGFDAPGFGPSSATIPPGRMLFALVSVGVVAEPWFCDDTR